MLSRLRGFFRGSSAGFIIFLTAFYLARVAGPLVRRLWFDELFTYYIAQAPTWPRMWDAMTHVDFNPPLVYVLVRLFQAVFGASELVARLPEAIAFYLGSIGAFLFLRRRIGSWWSTAAVLLFWSTPYLRYATQARPYGLLVCFFSLALLAYDAARRTPRGKLALPALALATLGMMLSHVFAPLSILPFCAAEAVRALMRRRIDRGIWACLLLPMTISFAYLPATRSFQRILFPSIYQASDIEILYFFERLGILYIFPGVLIAAVLSWMCLRFLAKRERALPGGWPALAWAVAILLPPATLNLLLERSGGAFWERYCITTALAFYMLVMVGLGWVTGFRRSSGFLACLTFCIVGWRRPYPSDSQAPFSRSLAGIRQDLPLVAGSGLTFLEMDHYEKTFQPRLYYLVDREAAVRYAHATIFENMPQVAQYFPVAAHVSAYREFLNAHSHFLVLSRRDFVEEWVLPKLCSDGAQITFLGSLAGPAKDFQLYEIQR